MRELSFDHPDVEAVLETVFNVLVVESDRGAVLVGAELISDNLGNLLKEVFPQDLDAGKLLEYPGLLSSAASRCEAAYAFRLISGNLRRAINLLRRVRNAAAHSPAEFSLASHSDRLREVYSATVKPGDFVAEAARRFMAARLAAVSHAVDEKLGRPARNYSEDELQEFLASPEISLHLPKYQLAAAVSLICGLIVDHKARIHSAFQEGTLMPEILEVRRPAAAAPEGDVTPNPGPQPDDTASAVPRG